MQVERDMKPWAGQLCISHTTEATCKILYKKFFRRTDCTILHGQWKHILLEQKRVFQVEDVTTAELSPPNGSPSSSPSQQRKVASNASNSRSRVEISSSRHGIVSPAQLEPFQCFILFYTSIPQLKNRRLERIFGPALAPKIEAYIRDEFNGEQGPGTSFLLETGSLPCKYIVCTSVARNISFLSPDYAYNAFRSSLLSIYNHNKKNHTNQITSILCPAMESITTPALQYNLVHQMATCYENWDWRMYAKGAVLPLTHEDEENINKQIKTTSGNLVQMAKDLERYMGAGLLVSRGLIYNEELSIVLDWLTNKSKGKEKGKEKTTQIKTDIPQHIIAQSLVDLLKRPELPPFILTPSQICSGITVPALETILKLAIEGHVKAYDDIKYQDLKFGRQLAEGTSGKLYEADWGERRVAVKMFKEQDPDLFMQELSIISLVKHPKLVEPLGGFFGQRAAYIVSELMDMNLLQLLQLDPGLPFNTKLHIAIDIAEAMEFLHFREVIHRDLKSVNVLVNFSTKSAKVCDFGLSRVIGNTTTLTGGVGTILWMAPEILARKTRYNEKCDVYSFAMILFELITHALPFKAVKDDISTHAVPELVKKGVRPKIPEEVLKKTPKEYIELMQLCWHANPNKRPSFSDILKALRPLVRDMPLPSNPADADDNSVINTDSSDEESTENSSDTTSSSNVMEQEENALDELRPWLQSVHHPLANEDLLLKCIRTKDCKPVAAKHLLVRYIEWYQLISSGTSIKISEVRKTLEEKIFYYVEGARDKEGRHITFFDVSNYDMEKIPEPALIRAVVYSLERATETPESQTKGIIILANLANFNMGRYSTRIVRSFFGTLGKYFPVKVHKIFILNAPSFFSKVLTMYQVFIGSTMGAIEIVTLTKLQDYVTIENVIPALNGTFHFDMDLWIRARHALEGVEYQQ